MADRVETPDLTWDRRAFLREAGPEGVIGIVLIAAILVVMSLGVFFRYVLNDSLSWSEELSRYGLIYATFIGAALAARRGTQIRVTMLDELAPAGWRPWLRILQDIVTLAFVVYVTYLAARIIPILHGTRSAAMLLPMSTVYAAIVVGFALTAIRLVIGLWRTGVRRC